MKPDLLKIILINFLFGTLIINAQKEHTISIQTVNPAPGSKPGETVANNAADLFEHINVFARSYADYKCLEKVNPVVEENIKTKMKQLEEGKPFVLVVDYKNCKFISLLPDNGFGEIIDPNWIVYHITVYPEIKRDPIITGNEDLRIRKEIKDYSEMEKISTTDMLAKLSDPDFLDKFNFEDTEFLNEIMDLYKNIDYNSEESLLKFSENLNTVLKKYLKQF